MEYRLYLEMINNLRDSIERDFLSDRDVFLFGHCEASIKIAEELLDIGIRPVAILDNNSAKQGLDYKGICIVEPEQIIGNVSDPIVLIATRFYESMAAQLRGLGFKGEIRRLVKYNTYAEYSLSEETINRKYRRCERGYELIKKMEEEHKGEFFVLCPFPALGDIYYCMSFLQEFLTRRNIYEAMVCVSSKACAKVVELYGRTAIVCHQHDLDSIIQAAIYYSYSNAFIAHHDRPYVVNLHRALYDHAIPFVQIYRDGVFGLGNDVKPMYPVKWREFDNKIGIREGKAAILSPYAKSVANISMDIWGRIVSVLKEKDYQVFTNVTENELPLPGTVSICPDITELKSVVEKAGLFIGIRSGLCDLIQTANCRKIVIFPDYYYCDTEWKTIDLFYLEGFEIFTDEQSI